MSQPEASEDEEYLKQRFGIELGVGWSKTLLGNENDDGEHYEFRAFADVDLGKYVIVGGKEKETSGEVS